MIPIPSLTTGHEGPAPAPRRRRPVVLLRKDGAPHRFAWSRALQLASALETSVVEVRLVEARARRRPRPVDWLLDVRARWERRFGRQFARPPLLTLPAGDTEHLVEALGELEPKLVVLGAAAGFPGDSVVALAAESGTPCVVARCPRPAHAVVASSRLADPELPVVRAAAAVAEALHRSLTVHHHVEPPIAQAPRPDPEPRLEALAQAREAEVALTRGVDPVTGILSVADAADADMVVIGAARGHCEVAPRVAALSSHSVMVVPTSK